MGFLVAVTRRRPRAQVLHEIRVVKARSSP
jgi:hypothetical protein